MLKRCCLAALTATVTLLGATAVADGIGMGQPLPQLHIEDRGELVLRGDAVSYRPWTLPGSIGKYHVLQYMAGTKAASKLNEPFTERLKTLAHDNFRVTTIINLDDATWGTTGFVVGEVKKNKRRYPDSFMVLDADGMGRELWKLQRKSSAIVITDASGSVRYLKEGAMSPQDIEQALKLIHPAQATAPR